MAPPISLLASGTSNLLQGRLLRSDEIPTSPQKYSIQRSAHDFSSLKSRKLSPLEMELAAYMTGRAAVGRPVNENERYALQKATLNMAAVKKLMSFGRGNVEEDIKATAGLSIKSFFASRETIKKFKFGSSAEQAGAEAFLKAGSCGEYGFVAQHVYADKMSKDEKTYFVSFEGIHDFSVLEYKKEKSLFSRGETDFSIMDPWLDGCAVSVADGRYTQNFYELKFRCLQNSECASEKYSQFKRGYENYQVELKTEFEKQLKIQQQNPPQNYLGICCSHSVISDESAAEMAKALNSTSIAKKQKYALIAAKALGADDEEAEAIVSIILDRAIELNQPGEPRGIASAQARLD